MTRCLDLSVCVREQHLENSKMAPSSAIVVSFSSASFVQSNTDYSKGKIKVQLKLSISRLRMVQQKDTAIAKQQRRAMAVLLEVHTNTSCWLASS